MKKIYTLCAAALVAASTATAQQLPDGIGTFDGAWEDCLPDGTNVVGTQPKGWMASNVYKYFLVDVRQELVFQEADRVYTENVAYHSVNMKNLFAGVSIGFGEIGATAPGYITLGSSWAYGDVSDPSINGNSDGGSYGSIDFAYRPDAISLYIKRSHGTEKADEKASVIFYAWKGSTTSTVTTGLSTSPVTTQMVNRDKDVLGMITDGVTKSDDFELISKSENYIDGNFTTWSQKVFPITYLSDNAPDKLNIIISSSDYFNRANLGRDNSLTVDDVTLVYYSTLSSLTIGGNEIALTDGTYEYEGTGAMPDSADEVAYTTKGRYADAKVSIDEAARTVTITVTNQGGADLDGETSHTYTVTYPAAPVEYPGYLNIEMMGAHIATNSPATVEIADNGDGTCTFALPNFSLDLGTGTPTPLGDIVVENVTMTADESGNTAYTGSADGLQLAGGVITANVVINGTITVEGVADFDIDVEWVSGGSSIPISVTFTTEKVVSVENTAEYRGYIATYSYGEPIGFNEPKSLIITNYSDGSCTVAMPEVNIQGISLGDITIPAAISIDDETGTATYTGSATLEEVMGQAPVVTLNGSIGLDEETTKISVEMNFDIAIGQLGSYTVTFTVDKQIMYTEPYEVYQNVTLNGEKTVTDEAVELEIDYYGDGTCLLTAPMNVTFEGWEFGDILGIDNIAMTVGENGTTLAASEEDEFEGSHASVVLDGTIGNDGKVNIKVVLTVDDQTATITYTTDKLGGTTSVEDIYVGTAIYGTEGAIVVSGYNGTAFVYATDGSLVKSEPVDGEATILVDNGIYIVRIADAVEKVMVK